MSDQNETQMRALARKIADRAASDPAFKAQIQKDPQKTLTAEGIPEQYIGLFLEESQIGDVAGYGKPNTISVAFCCLITV